MIRKVSDEQLALIPKLYQEYLEIGLNTDPINLPEMKKVIDAWYAYIKQPAPTYFVFSSPALCSIFCSVFLGQLGSQLRSQLYSQLGSQLGSQLYDGNCWYANLASSWISYFKCGGLWGVKYSSEVEAYLNQWDHMARHGFHWWPRVGVAVCSDRPRKIFFNNEKRLHADGKLAVEFSDGWGVYSFDGVRLPEQYGSVHSKDWKPEWFVKETNVELKRILAKQIGYEKLFKSLEAKKLDTWREYELFRIENVDVEPMHILSMTCPSTGHRHFGRVPPDCMFAREAATLRNKGIDPEIFEVEH